MSYIHEHGLEGVRWRGISPFEFFPRPAPPIPPPNNCGVVYHEFVDVNFSFRILHEAELLQFFPRILPQGSPSQEKRATTKTDKHFLLHGHVFD
jgi:hypothetical protein